MALKLRKPISPPNLFLLSTSLIEGDIKAERPSLKAFLYPASIQEIDSGCVAAKHERPLRFSRVNHDTPSLPQLATCFSGSKIRRCKLVPAAFIYEEAFQPSEQTQIGGVDTIIGFFQAH